MARALLAPALGLALSPLTALAQAPAAPCVARDPVTAEINAREGVRLAKEEQFEAAEALFLTATRLDPCMPKYPYLLGRAHDRQDAFEAAAAAYQTVIDRFPTSVEFTKAQGALIELRAREAAAAKQAEQEALKAEAARKAEEAAAEEAARRAAEAAARKAAEDARRAALARGDGGGVTGTTAVEGDVPWAVVGWLGAGLGVVALGTGLGFSLAARDADDELTLAATRPDRARYDALVDERETFSTLGWVGYGVGAALVLGGLTLVLVDEDPRPTVTPTPGGAVMGLSGRF